MFAGAKRLITAHHRTLTTIAIRQASLNRFIPIHIPTIHTRFIMTTSEQMQDITNGSSVAAATQSVAPTSTVASPNSASDVDMETVWSCQLHSLSGWDGPGKIEKRLKEYSIGFKDVFKRKGPKEDTGIIYFTSEQQMKESMEKMEGIREEPTVNKMEDTQQPPAVNADGERIVKLTKTVFKMRNPQITTRKRRLSPRRDQPKQKEFRSAKRTKIELAEGEIGYAEAAEEARSASEGEDEPAATSSSEGRPGRPVSPTFEVEKTINDVVAPLWRKPYADQLVIKRNGVKELMQASTAAWKREYGNTLTFPHGSEEPNPKSKKQTAMFCPLEDIVPSPITEAYRNKCEFSIGLNEKEEVAIGHLMGKYLEGTITVESIQDCPHVPLIGKRLSQTLLEFIHSYPATTDGSASSSSVPSSAATFPPLIDPSYKPYDKRDHSGFYRIFVVRNSAETKEVMCLLQVTDKGKTQEEMDAFKNAFKNFWREKVFENPSWSAENEGYKCLALQLQTYTGVSNAAPEGTPIELLLGKEACIHEKLMGLEFRVSQNAFFQINIPQTNKLYSIAAEFAKLPPADASAEVKAKNILFDVCCGTGTIGLSLANRVGKVIGLEMSASAIEDAKYNAKVNGIENAFYYVGKAEDTISKALLEHVGNTVNLTPSQIAAQASQIVTAIVDPPRSGLHADVVRLLRKCPRIDRIVYVSCNPKTLMENLQRFVQPTSKKLVEIWTGAPFTAIKAVPVDMFPMTDHCEMVVLLERERPQPVINKFKQPTKVFAHQLAATTPAATPSSAASSGGSNSSPMEIDTAKQEVKEEVKPEASASSAP